MPTERMLYPQIITRTYIGVPQIFGLDPIHRARFNTIPKLSAIWASGETNRKFLPDDAVQILSNIIRVTIYSDKACHCNVDPCFFFGFALCGMGYRFSDLLDAARKTQFLAIRTPDQQERTSFIKNAYTCRDNNTCRHWGISGMIVLDAAVHARS